MAPADLKEQIPGISGTRALNDNLSDMKAQVASNFKGIGLVTALIEEYTLEVVQAYMHHIQVRVRIYGLYLGFACRVYRVVGHPQARIYLKTSR
jgi:hypothetical protein